MIVTFYSYRGGVGRSMALANVGEILADMGYRVIVCDWDLEAPGLERYLVTSYTDDTQYRREMDEYQSWPGLMDLLEEYKQTLTRPAEPGEPSATDDTQYASIQNLRVRRPSSFARATADALPRGSLRLITAGRRNGEALSRYAESVRTFDWQDFYDRWAGDAYIDFFRRDLVGDPREQLEGACDLLLIDSRTGVTEQGGVCTHHLADLVVLVTAANDLNMDGAKWMLRALTDERLPKIRGGRALRVLPVASRIEQQAEIQELIDFRRRFREAFGKQIDAVVGDSEKFSLAAEIPYMPFYSFHERVVAREPETKREQKLYAAYHSLAEGIVRYGTRSSLLRPQTSQGIIARPSAPSPRTSEGWDAGALIKELTDVLVDGDPGALEQYTARLEKDLQSRDDPFPDAVAMDLLATLRRGGQYQPLSRLSTAFQQAGLDSLRIRIQGAHAQIQLGQLTAALALLEAVLTRAKPDSTEGLEARVLIGYVYKQLYLEANDSKSARSVRNLERAINEFVEVYRANPLEQTFSGINAVALVMRARRDDVRLEAAPDPAGLAHEILSVIEQRDASHSIDQWNMMTAVEACLALGRDDAAAGWLRRTFESPDVNSFSLSSFEKHLATLWQLENDIPERATILSVLRAEIIEHAHGSVPVRAYEKDSQTDRDQLNVLYGWRVVRSLESFRTGLARSKAVVRIQNIAGKTVGTGFLFPGRVVHASLNDACVLVAPAHVLSPDAEFRGGLRLEEAAIVLGNADADPLVLHLRVRKLLLSSPDLLDVTVATVEPPIAWLEGYPIASAPPAQDERVYLIGHPGGAELSISDGTLLDCEDSVLQYRAPTEAGSSGSPLFNAQWELIGFHHASGPSLRRLHGQEGTYAASEGIWIGAVLKEVAGLLDIAAAREAAKSQTGRAAPVRLFLSYSHKDARLRDELQKHLALLQRQGVIDVWDDRAIAPGERWRDEIQRALEASDIVLPLISADFLASSYSVGEELQRAVERGRTGKARVIPVMIRPALLEGSMFAPFQVLPRNGEAISSMTDRDAAWVEVVRAIKQAAEEIAKKRRPENAKAEGQAAL